MPHKIDPSGNYLPFSGMTVIAPVNPAETIWQEIHTILSSNKTLLRYFSLLPATSYHCTLFSLPDEGMANIARNWRADIKPLLPALSQLQQQLTKTPISLTPSFKHINAAGVLQIIMTVPQTQADNINQHKADIYGATRYKESTERHITLAYQFKPIKKSHEDSITETLLQVVKKLEQIEDLSLQPAHVCTFKDMTAFTRWSIPQIPKTSATSTLV